MAMGGISAVGVMPHLFINKEKGKDDHDNSGDLM